MSTQKLNSNQNQKVKIVFVRHGQAEHNLPSFSSDPAKRALADP